MKQTRKETEKEQRARSENLGVKVREELRLKLVLYTSCHVKTRPELIKYLTMVVKAKCMNFVLLLRVDEWVGILFNPTRYGR